MTTSFYLELWRDSDFLISRARQFSPVDDLSGYELGHLALHS